MVRERKRHSSKALVSARRWASYAVAGAATTLASGEEATAGIVYSGLVNADLSAVVLRLENGATIARGLTGGWQSGGGAHAQGGSGTLLLGSSQALFDFRASFVGGYQFSAALLDNLDANTAVSAVVPSPSSTPGRTVWVRGTGFTFSDTFYGGNFHTWTFGAFGTGFAAMRFDVGQGTQYAWLRIHESTLIDWAYGTPGQALLTGQTGVPESGSLGLLAVGAAGLLAWRGARRPEAPRRILS